MKKVIVNEHEFIKFTLLILIGIAVLSGLTSCGSKSGQKLVEKRKQQQLDSIASKQQWYYTIDLGGRNLIKAVDYEKILGRRVGDSVCIDMEIDEFNPQFTVVTTGHWMDTDGSQPIYHHVNQDSIVGWMHYEVGVIVSFDPQPLSAAWPQ